MIDLTSRQLRAFLLIAHHRSFTRAAGALFITPSGLSLLIRELENQLGARLFERTTRQVLLTRAGSQLLSTVERNLHSLEDAMADVGKNDGSESSLSLVRLRPGHQACWPLRSRNSGYVVPIFASALLMWTRLRYSRR
jgi:DNA-binding transcriptional LysR family regulator